MSQDLLDLSRTKSTKILRVANAGKCFFIILLDKCHRLQVRCWEITEILLFFYFYYHFLHLQVKLWRWYIGIITEPLCQRKWSCCLLHASCAEQTYILVFLTKKASWVQLWHIDGYMHKVFQSQLTWKYSHGKVPFWGSSWSLSVYSAECQPFRQYNEVSFCCISVDLKAQKFKFSSFSLGVHRCCIAS